MVTLFAKHNSGNSKMTNTQTLERKGKYKNTDLLIVWPKAVYWPRNYLTNSLSFQWYSGISAHSPSLFFVFGFCPLLVCFVFCIFILYNTILTRKEKNIRISLTYTSEGTNTNKLKIKFTWIFFSFLVVFWYFTPFSYCRFVLVCFSFSFCELGRWI